MGDTTKKNVLNVAAAAATAITVACWLRRRGYE